MAKTEPPSDSPTAGAPSAAFRKALVRLLRPLVRLLIARGVTFPAFSQLVKRVYIDVAARDFPQGDRTPTDSRINVLTGVHRKEIRRLRQEGTENEAPPASVSLGGQLIGVWTGDPRYRDAQDRILPLSRRAEADLPSFDALVESVSKDVRPRAVLDEWSRLGIVTIDDDQRIWLNAEAFVPQAGFEEKAYYFGRNLGDHIAAAAHNLEGQVPPKMERSVYYDELTPDSVARLQTMAEERGMAVLKALNEAALDYANRDAGRADATQRFNFGLYFYDGAMAWEKEENPGEEDQ